MAGDCLYVHRRTGEILRVMRDDFSLVWEDADPEDLPDWEAEQLPLIREAVESEEWVALPTKFDIHEYRIMERSAMRRGRRRSGPGF